MIRTMKYKFLISLVLAVYSVSALIQIPTLAEKEMQVTFIKTFTPNCAASNLVWIGTTDSLFVAENTKPSEAKIVTGIKETHIKTVLFELGKYWVTSHNGLYMIEPTDPTKATRVEGLQSTIIVNFYVLPNNNLIAFDYKNRLFYVDTKTLTGKEYEELQDFAIAEINNKVCTSSDCAEESKRFLWLTGNLGGGLFYIDKNNPAKAIKVNELNAQIVTELQQIGNYLWISTLTNGVYRLNLNDFSVINVSGLQGKQISKLIRSGNTLFVGSLTDGAYSISLTAEIPEAKPLENLAGEPVSLITATDKYVWIARDFNGGFTGTPIEQPEKEQVIHSISDKKVLEILSALQKIWFRAGLDEVFVVDDKQPQKIQTVRGLQGKQIANLKLIGDNLFFLERNKGAFVLNKDTDNFAQSLSGLRDKKMNAIYFKEGLLWAESYAHDIFVIRPEEPTKAIELQNMAGINIWSINRLPDNGDYIVGSNKGAFIVSASNLGQAQLIPETKDQSTTSIVRICDKLWIGTLNGYKVLDINLL